MLAPSRRALVFFVARRTGHCLATAGAADARLRDPTPLRIGEAMRLIEQRRLATNTAGIYRFFAKTFGA